METTPPSRPSDDPGHAAPATPLSSHLPCIACGYDLHGLAADSLCPECAEPIQHTLGHLLLNTLGARCMTAMRLGIWLISIAAAAGPAAIGVAIVAMVLINPPFWIISVIIGGIVSLWLLSMNAGWWIFATPSDVPPAQRPAASRRSIRRQNLLCIAARVSAALFALMVPLWWVYGWYAAHANTPRYDIPYRDVFNAFSIASVAAWTFRSYACHVLIRERAPRKSRLASTIAMLLLLPVPYFLLAEFLHGYMLGGLFIGLIFLGLSHAISSGLLKTLVDSMKPPAEKPSP